MRLSEILKPQNIKIPLIAQQKIDAIKELVQLLADTKSVADPKKVLDSVLDREATRTTGIGNGLAIPHGKTTGATDLVMAIGRPAEPIWLASSPPDKTGPHIQALARISKLMLNDSFRQSLNAAQGPQEMFDIIVRQEALL
jgi:nitrogen PTS system EIIA component